MKKQIWIHSGKTEMERIRELHHKKFHAHISLPDRWIISGVGEFLVTVNRSRTKAAASIVFENINPYVPAQIYLHLAKEHIDEVVRQIRSNSTGGTTPCLTLELR